MQRKEDGTETVLLNLDLMGAQDFGQRERRLNYGQ